MEGSSFIAESATESGERVRQAARRAATTYIEVGGAAPPQGELACRRWIEEVESSAGFYRSIVAEQRAADAANEGREEELTRELAIAILPMLDVSGPEVAAGAVQFLRGCVRVTAPILFERFPALHGEVSDAVQAFEEAARETLDWLEDQDDVFGLIAARAEDDGTRIPHEEVMRRLDLR